MYLYDFGHARAMNENDFIKYFVVYKNDILGFNTTLMEPRISLDEAVKLFNRWKDRFVSECDFFDELIIETYTDHCFVATDGVDYVAIRILQTIE